MITLIVSAVIGGLFAIGVYAEGDPKDPNRDSAAFKAFFVVFIVCAAISGLFFSD